MSTIKSIIYRIKEMHDSASISGGGGYIGESVRHFEDLEVMSGYVHSSVMHDDRIMEYCTRKALKASGLTEQPEVEGPDEASIRYWNTWWGEYRAILLVSLIKVIDD